MAKKYYCLNIEYAPYLNRASLFLVYFESTKILKYNSKTYKNIRTLIECTI